MIELFIEWRFLSKPELYTSTTSAMVRTEPQDPDHASTHLSSSNLNPDQQSVTPMTHTSGSSAGHPSYSLYWALHNKSTRTSPVSDKTSRYSLDPQLLRSMVHMIKEDRIQWEGKYSVPHLCSTQCTLEDRGTITAAQA
ncbi:uncharacterized protein si:dkey-13n15.2 isoform X2 [Carassius gibelio]|uniref:uncharacterized protein si:dkey-13n15.2 isoform X2 n=1 Tax=Carassius gibelio TaxID=101364 RepID=UPI002279C386|nr:uncharacterized protein si:dkey-13n15.2 isoform X2 [Carassius gibelio]